MDIKRFLEEDGRVKQIPAKNAYRQQVLGYLAEKFDPDRKYTEKEVNAIIEAWHSFGDYFLIRRELVDHDWLRRTPNGSAYWRSPRPHAIISP